MKRYQAVLVDMFDIWIDRGVSSLPPGTPPPTHTVSSFAEIADFL